MKADTHQTGNSAQAQRDNQNAPDCTGRAGQPQPVPDTAQTTQRRRGRPRNTPLSTVPVTAAQVVPIKPIPSAAYRRPLPMLQSEPTPIQIDTCIQLAKACGLEVDSPEQLAGVLAGVERSSKDAQARAVIFLSSVAAGSRHKESFIISGLQQIDLCVYAAMCPDFGKMYDYARKAQSDSMGNEVLAAALHRAVDGVDEPVIGRIGKDEDGIICTKKRYSDRLAETLLKGTDKRFRDDSGLHPTGASTTYNINYDYRQQVAIGPGAQAPAPKQSGGITAEKVVEECQAVDITALTDI